MRASADRAELDSTSHEEAGSSGKRPPLCVDLDGTLLLTDILYESILILLKARPWQAFLLPIWLIRGKAYLKWRVARQLDLTGREFPCCDEVLDFIESEKSRGRDVILATACERTAAVQVAQRFDVFETIIATEAGRNLRGNAKSRALVEKFGKQGFDYVGNGAADLPAWRAARSALLVNPSKRLLEKARRESSVTRVFERPRLRLADVVRAIRLHQWAKNALVFVPLAMAHRLLEPDPLFRSLGAFLVFGAIASSIYLLNDLFDLEADRRHPTKKLRPLAAGVMSIPAASTLLLGLSAAGTLLALLVLPPMFLGLAALYASLCVLYTLRLRTVPVLDAILLGSLYTLRVLSGGVASDVPVSNWLMAFSMFFFLSLAFMKRFSELALHHAHGETANGRGYVGSDAAILQNMGVVSGYVSILVLALYMNGEQVSDLYDRPALLWLICPILLYGVNRMWLLAYRGEIDDDPLMESLRDPVHYVLGVLVVLILIAAA